MDRLAVEHMVYNWYYLLVPFLIIFWVMTIKHFNQRQQKQLKSWQIHIPYSLIFAALIAQISLSADKAALRTKSNVFVEFTGGILLFVKDAFAEVLYAIIPNFQNLWLADAIFNDNVSHIPLNYMIYSFIYIGLFIFVVMLFAIYIFNNREVGSGSLD